MLSYSTKYKNLSEDLKDKRLAHDVISLSINNGLLDIFIMDSLNDYLRSEALFSEQLGGDIDLSNSPITFFDYGIHTIDGSLTLSNSMVGVIPESLKVTKDLDLRDSLITRLPENLIVGGSIFMNHDLFFNTKNSHPMFDKIVVD